MAVNSEWLVEIWHHRELLWFLAWRDVKVRYKQAVLGAGWAIFQPLSSMIVFTLFFGRLTGIANDDVPYPVFTYCALLPWTYFSGTLSQTSPLTKAAAGKIIIPLCRVDMSETLPTNAGEIKSPRR